MILKLLDILCEFLARAFAATAISAVVAYVYQINASRVEMDSFFYGRLLIGEVPTR